MCAVKESWEKKKNLMSLRLYNAHKNGKERKEKKEENQIWIKKEGICYGGICVEMNQSWNEWNPPSASLHP